LARQVSGLTAALADRDAVIAAQAARIAEPGRRPGPGSSNSGKPPPGDGPAKPTAEELRERRRSRRRKGGRTPGGQRGHAGSAPARREVPDRTGDRRPAACAACGGALDAGMSAGSAARQVHDLPEPSPPGVTGHRAHRCVRTACGAETRADFPEGVAAPVRYGPRLAALVVYLGVARPVPLRRLRQTLADLFGAHLSQGTIAGPVAGAAGRSAGPARHVRDAVASASVRHMDGTGIRVRGRLAWPRVACTRFPGHFRVGAGRGDVMADATGIAVHARRRPHSSIPGTVPPLCAAHVPRGLQDRVDFDEEAWAGTMARLPRRAVHAVNLSEGKPLPERLADLIGRSHDGIVAAGLAMHEARPPPAPPGRRGRRKRRRGHSPVLRLRDSREGVLRFTPAVPRFPRPATGPGGRCGPSGCSGGSPEACAARKAPGTTRRCGPCPTRPGNRAGTCWRRSAHRRTGWSRGPPRGSRPGRAEPPAGREAARMEPEQLPQAIN